MEIGNRCYINGAIGEIVGQDGKSRWVVLLNEIYEGAAPIITSIGSCRTHTQLTLFRESNTCYVLDKKDVHPVASDIFTLGDSVLTTYQGSKGFKGTVVGFEHLTNRIICKSETQSKQYGRIRYAYTVDEIEKLDPIIAFELNHKYRSTSDKVYRTVEAPRTDKMMLIDDCTGKFVAYVTETTKRAELQDRIEGTLTEI